MSPTDSPDPETRAQAPGEPAPPAETSAEPVTLDGACVRVGGRTILGPVDLVVGAGERWVLLGPNGGGKTTLLTLAGARRQPSSGRVTVLGTTLGRGDIRKLHGRIGHSSHALADLMPPHLAAEAIVLTGKRATLTPWFETYDAADRRRAVALLEQLGCAHLRERPFSTASQGERQRVLLARALFTEPELLLLDEPASGLDLPAREALIRALETEARPGGRAMIVATHHLEEIPPSATHAALLRDARLVATGPIEEVVTAERLERTFDLAVDVGRRSGRWWVAARPI